MNSARKRVVFDTNILISAALGTNALPARILQVAIETCDIYLCQETFDELSEVIFRPKLECYFRENDIRTEFLETLRQYTLFAEITHPVTDCIDPKDNIFLSLARSVNAHFLVSGDKKHLLSMNPYQGILILTPAQFMVAIN